MERMSAAHCSKVRQGWLGVEVWWMNRWERGRERFVGVPLYGFAPHMQRGIIVGHSETDWVQSWKSEIMPKSVFNLVSRKIRKTMIPM